jgi:hypothetical protein
MSPHASGHAALRGNTGEKFGPIRTLSLLGKHSGFPPATGS